MTTLTRRHGRFAIGVLAFATGFCWWDHPALGFLAFALLGAAYGALHD